MGFAFWVWPEELSKFRFGKAMAEVEGAKSSAASLASDVAQERCLKLQSFHLLRHALLSVLCE